MPMARAQSSKESVGRSWSAYLSPAARVWTCAAIGVVACKQAPLIPEDGALLLEVTVASNVLAPDELRLAVYDDSGVLWSNVRFPTEGTLKPESAERLGTILIQPGPTDRRVRVHARGFNQGRRALDATLVVNPGERSRGAFHLTLDAALPPDVDNDGVPDDIDDCPGETNPNQGGCPSGVPQGRDAGMLLDAPPPSDAIKGADADGRADGINSAPADAADAPADANLDTVTPDGRDAAKRLDGPADDGIPGFDVQPDTCGATACQKPAGASCVSETECLSTFCVDGVCCANACLGLCRSCNQPNFDGVCRAHPGGSNPEGECLAGATCNGAGACGPPPSGAKPNGQLCSGANECLSGFCTDGVCCGSSCTAACQTCATGTCQLVTRKADIPECAAPLKCNPQGRCG